MKPSCDTFWLTRRSTLLLAQKPQETAMPNNEKSKLIFISGKPSEIMKKSLIQNLQKKSFRYYYAANQSLAAGTTSQSSAPASASNPSNPTDIPLAYTETSGSSRKSRKKKDKKEPKKVQNISPQELEKRALEELEALRLKKRAIFTKIRERLTLKERKKEAALLKSAGGSLLQ